MISKRESGASRVVAGGNWVERHRSLFYPTLMSLGIGVLVSCAEKPPPPPPQPVAYEPPPSPPAVSPRRQRVFPLPAHKPAPPPEKEANPLNAGTGTLALAAPESNVREETQRPLTATQLIGLDEPTARRLLGVAGEQAEAPPAKIWRYRSLTCELDLFFYLDLRSGKMRILHYSFKGDEGGKENCLRSLVVARGP